MSRYAQMFERLKQRNEGAFGAFLMLGDPDKQTSAQLLDRVVEAGAEAARAALSAATARPWGASSRDAWVRTFGHGSWPSCLRR